MRFKDSQFYTTETISPNLEKTPEGYLLCRGVPISRVGVFDYTSVEAGLPAGADGLVHMKRDASELFAPEAMASFEGKDVVIGHSSFLDPKNWRRRSIGAVQNVRRGEGEQADKLLADLLIKDADGIRLVESGRLREVSCGYDAKPIADGDGNGHQVGIVGNHVALVEKGRCGDTCKIRDGAMTKSLKTVLRRMFKDGDEDAFNEALDKVEVRNADEDGTEPIKPQADPQKTPEERISVLEHEYGEMGQKIDAIRQMLEKVVAEKAPVADEDPKPEPTPDPEAEPVTDECAKQTLDEAEELCPGMKRPTGDAKGGKYTAGLMERVKRQALKGAGVTQFGDAAMLEGKALDTAFTAALLLKRASNNPKAKPFGDSKGGCSNADLNKRFADFWSKKGA
jgi:hypothetical protein